MDPEIQDRLREHLRKSLRTAGFIDPDDGTVPIWPNGDQGAAVWTSWSVLADTILANIGKDEVRMLAHGVGPIVTDEPSTPYRPVCGDMSGPNGVGGECVLPPGHPHVDGIGGEWPVEVS